MSKIFYDHLVVFAEIETHLSSHPFHPKEKEEIHQMIEETIHFRVMTRILNHLPRPHHKKFLELFHQAPYNDEILLFLKEKVANIEELIREEITLLEKELLEDIKSQKSPTKESLKLKKR